MDDFLKRALGILGGAPKVIGGGALQGAQNIQRFVTPPTISPIPTPPQPNPIRDLLSGAQRIASNPVVQQSFANGVPWLNPRNAARPFVEQTIPSALQTGANALLEPLTKDPMTIRAIPENKVVDGKTAALQTLGTLLQVGSAPVMSANPIGYGKTMLKSQAALQGTGELFRGLKEKQSFKDLAMNVVKGIAGVGTVAGPISGLAGDKPLAQAADLLLNLAIPFERHANVNEITTRTPEVEKQLRDAMGRWVAGETPIKPKGMAQASWKFQLDFNSKYQRNPYAPVFNEDLQKAIQIEAEKRMGMQVRPVGADKISANDFEAQMDAKVAQERMKTPNLTADDVLKQPQGIPPKPVQTQNASTKSQSQAEAVIGAEGKTNVYKDIISRWLGENKNAELEGYQFGKQFEQTDPKVAEKLIKEMESGNVSPELKPLADQYRQLDDQVYRMANDNGIPVDYLKDHVTHIWKENFSQVQKDYKNFKFKYGLDSQRTIPTYEEGIKMGLTPRYSDPRQILGYQVKQLLKVRESMLAFGQLKEQGLIVPASVGAGNPDFKPVSSIGFPQSSQVIDSKGTTIKGQWFAPKEVANEIEKVFGEKPDVSKWLSIPARVSGWVQDLTMSGGLPGTPVNSWTFAQMTKEVLAGRIASPIKAVFAGPKYFDEKVPVIKRMQTQDLSVNIGRGLDDLSAPQGMGKIGDLWNKAVNNPTFQKFAPALQINFFEDVSNQLQAKGMSLEQADAIAAKAVKNFYGTSGSYADAISSKAGAAAIKALFFAPRYRESIVNFWVNSLKGLKDPLSPENINNTRFLAGAAISLFTMNQINEKLNGHGMMQNPSGMEDKLMIPLGKITGNPSDDTVISIPFLSSIATIPRLGVRTVGNLLQGDVKTATTDVAGTLLSQPIKPVFDIAKNSDYFGKPITQGDETGGEKWKKYLVYYANQFNHPYLKELLDPRNQEDPAYQRLSRAMELPMKYYTEAQIDTKRYFDVKGKAEKGLDQKEQAANASIPKADSNDPNTRMLKYQIFLTYPKVFEAKQRTELETAGQTGKSIDPLYLVNYDTAKKYMRYEALPEGSPDRKSMTQSYPELLKLMDMRSQYFTQNPIPNAKPSNRPMPGADVQAAMDRKDWNYPGVRNYLDANTQYNNTQRQLLNLPPITSGYSSGGKSAASTAVGKYLAKQKMKNTIKKAGKKPKISMKKMKLPKVKMKTSKPKTVAQLLKEGRLS
jgi:hypothetical protein